MNETDTVQRRRLSSAESWKMRTKIQTKMKMWTQEESAANAKARGVGQSTVREATW